MAQQGRHQENTIVVLVVVIIAAAVLFILDAIFGGILGLSSEADQILYGNRRLTIDGRPVQ